MSHNVFNGIQLFPDDAIFNRRCNDMPIHPLSATWMAALEASSGKAVINWNNGSGALPTLTNSISDTPAGIVITTYPQFCTMTNSFLPIDIPIDTSGDARVIALDTLQKRLTEISAASIVSGVWHASAGATWNVDEYANTPIPPGQLWALSSDAAGLPALPLCPRYEEIYYDKVINHALNCVVPATVNSALWPATSPGNTTIATNPPMGARLRLSQSFNIDTFDTRSDVRELLRQLQTYGLIVRDNGATSGLTIESTQDSRWNTTPFYAGTLVLPALSNWEFVDEHNYMIQSSSYQSLV